MLNLTAKIKKACILDNFLPLSDKINVTGKREMARHVVNVHDFTQRGCKCMVSLEANIQANMVCEHEKNISYSIELVGL